MTESAKRNYERWEGLSETTYLTIPNPRLTIITNILARARFTQDTNSANTIAP